MNIRAHRHAPAQGLHLRRIMVESAREFSHQEVARRYIEIYEEMLERPLVEKESGEVIKAIAESFADGKPGDISTRNPTRTPTPESS